MADGPKKVRVLKAGPNTPQTSGMRREQLAGGPDHWVGFIHTDPHTTGGWHHHGEYDSYLYVASGAIRVEFGKGGAEACEAGVGEVVHVPQHRIHRELNTSGEEQVLFGARVGHGEFMLNVDGPES